MIELALFDVDGTLMLTDDALLGDALADALGVPNRIEQLDHAGQTSAWLARGLLEGRDPPDGWCERAEVLYMERLGDTSSWRARPGSEEALDELERAGLRLALLTGLPEGVARLRMERLGLARSFPAGQGAFGCESERRAELIANALARAGVEPGRAVEIGDTPVDVSSARCAGIRSVAFAGCRPERVAQADAVVSSMPELPEAILQL